MVVVAFVVVIGALVVLAVGAWLIAQLTTQSGEIDCRLTDLEFPERARARAAAEQDDAARSSRRGFRASTVLNDFALPNLAGGTTTLSQWRGQRLALIFVHPACPFSRRLVRLIARRATQVNGDDPHLVIVSTGDADTNRALLGGADAHTTLALQEENEVARLMRVTATPAAYLVDPSGVTERPLLLGSDAILRALDASMPPGNPDDSSTEASETTPLPTTRRDRLPAIAPGHLAPSLVLTDLTGTRIVLGSDQEQRTVLVLIDPDCPASCDLAPHLAASLRSSGAGVDVVVVSAADAATTRDFAASLTPTIPVVPDQMRTVARAFGVLETPSAVLLDPGGIVAAPIAIGVEEVRALFAAGEAPDVNGRQRSRLRPSRPAQPLVSVILTTRDRPGFLRFALTCYQRQTYANRELIVVDDGDRYPADPQEIEAAGGRLVRATPGTPIGTKLNLGLDVARGTLCQKMDDDDYYAPAYVETMVEAILESWREACRPTLAFVTPFLFFDVARWEIRRSLDRNVPGATLFFHRSDWALHRFRPLPGDEDLWFFLDQVRAGAVPVVIEQPELFLAVRHRGSRSERGHTWVNQSDNRPLEDFLLERPLHSRTPDRMLPPWARAFYRDLRAELLASPEDAGRMPSAAGT
jgi:peroxiredoxin